MFDEQKPNAEGSYIILGAKIHNATFTIEKRSLTHPAKSIKVYISLSSIPQGTKCSSCWIRTYLECDGQSLKSKNQLTK